MFDEIIESIKQNRELIMDKINNPDQSVPDTDDKLTYLKAQSNNITLLLATINKEIDEINHQLEEKQENTVIKEDNNSNMIGLDDIIDNKIIIKEELESWGIANMESTGAKSIFAIDDLVRNGKINEETPYEDICEAIANEIKVSVKAVKVSLSILRTKNANFDNAKYITILGKLSKKDLTNERLIKEFIEICL